MSYKELIQNRIPYAISSKDCEYGFSDEGTNLKIRQRKRIINAMCYYCFKQRPYEDMANSDTTKKINDSWKIAENDKLWLDKMPALASMCSITAVNDDNNYLEKEKVYQRTIIIYLLDKYIIIDCGGAGQEIQEEWTNLGVPGYVRTYTELKEYYNNHCSTRDFQIILHTFITLLLNEERNWTGNY